MHHLTNIRSLGLSGIQGSSQVILDDRGLAGLWGRCGGREAWDFTAGRGEGWSETVGGRGGLRPWGEGWSETVGEGV